MWQNDNSFGYVGNQRHQAVYIYDRPALQYTCVSYLDKMDSSGKFLRYLYSYSIWILSGLLTPEIKGPRSSMGPEGGVWH